MKKDIGIYIHIPFCKSKCFYCDFLSFSNRSDLIEGYINSIIKEIQNADLSRYNINTVYIGGGTPSILESRSIGRILDCINANKKAEITIEVNPGTINEEKINDYISFGINRISIGLQSTNNILLKQIGRIHSFEQFLDAYKLVKKVGIENINVDLMLGLPNQTLEILKKSLKDIILLNPKHISIYSLILEEGTKLEEMINTNKLQMIDENEERKMYWETKRMLEYNGYIHYEISNFAKEGYVSKHNLDCWSQKEYLGFGVGAHSYVNGIRYSNLNNIDMYINHIGNREFGNNIIIHEKQNKYDMR